MKHSKDKKLFQALLKTNNKNHIIRFQLSLSLFIWRKLDWIFHSQSYYAFHIREPQIVVMQTMAGMANSRNTCVDMRLACVACRPLSETRLLCCFSLPFPPPPRLSRNLTDSSSLAARFPVSCMHPAPRRQIYPSLYCSYPIQCIELFSEHTEVELSQISVRTDFPLPAHSLWREIVVTSSLDSFDSFTRGRFNATKEYLSSRCKHTHISCSKLKLFRINQTFNSHLWILRTIKNTCENQSIFTQFNF